MLGRLFQFIILISFPVFANSIQTIKITKGHAEATPIAVNYFSSHDKHTNNISHEITKIIIDNLSSTGLFRIVPRDAYIELKRGEYRPNFASWRQINAPILLNGSIADMGKGNFEIKFILWDTISEQALAEQTYKLQERMLRRLSHKISDQVYQRITGDKGYFDTRIAYIIQSGNPKNPLKKLAIMDQDGHNKKILTDGRNMALTPRFSPKADKILYLSYTNDRPRLYLKDLRTNSENLLGNFNGMSYAPRFSPDGRHVIFSIAKNGASNIYEMNLLTKRSRKLTSGMSIDTSPTYSPDSKKIVFNSDRGGSRQIYVMNRDGSSVRRISFGAGSYVTPNWSPRGDYLAFTRISRDFGFTIGVMRPDGTGERIIANGYLTESPTWAPNGRVIMFAREEKPSRRGIAKSNIYAIDITGYHERKLPTKANASDPEWSNLLE
jgi:TolB protein